MTKAAKKKYEGKGILKMLYFSLSIGISIGLAVGVYFLNQKMNLGFDKSLTAYVAILGAVPTAYLWVIKERKKEEDLKNKNQELKQLKISELNKVYVDAINQFYNQNSFLAGAYSLNGLIDDWINLLNDDENEEYYYTRIRQISGIILSKIEERSSNHLFKVLSSNIVFKMINLQEVDKIGLRNFDLSNLDLKEINFSGCNLSGITFTNSDLSDADLSDCNLSRTTFTNSNLSKANLSGANLKFSDFSKSILFEADLSCIDTELTVFSKSDLEKAKLTNARISNSILSNSSLKASNLDNATLVYNVYDDTDFTVASFEKASLVKENLSTANLSYARFIDTEIDNENNVFHQRIGSHLVITLGSFLNNTSISWGFLADCKLLDIPEENREDFLNHLKNDYQNSQKFIEPEYLKSAFKKFSAKEN